MLDVCPIHELYNYELLESSSVMVLPNLVRNLTALKRCGLETSVKLAHAAYNNGSDVTRPTGDSCNGGKKLHEKVMGRPFPGFTRGQVFYCQLLRILQVKKKKIVANSSKLIMEG